MARSTGSSKLLSPLTQFLVGFVIPTVILLGFSDVNRLGPVLAMILALAFPVSLELYGLRVRRKPSLMSIVAIVGILLIGLISLLGLSEEWLAVRRSAIYFIAAIVLVGILRFRPGLAEYGLKRIINMPAVRAAAAKKLTARLIERHIARTGYIIAALLVVIGASAYLSTILFIDARAGTSSFNAEYARLRLISIGTVTAPLVIGLAGIVWYLISGFERLTGTPAEEFIKRKSTKK